MQIDTQKTVNQTLRLYLWDGPKGWQQKNSDTWQRDVYQDHRLTICQQMSSDSRCLVFETPEYTFFLSTGMRRDLQNPHNAQNVRYYSLNLETTQGEKGVYCSMIDDSHFQDIHGNRQLLFNFLKKVPQTYFSLTMDKNAPHISTYWMRTNCLNLRAHRPLIDKERT